jgi:hypothetical protein
MRANLTEAIGSSTLCSSIQAYREAMIETAKMVRPSSHRGLSPDATNLIVAERQTRTEGFGS